MFAQVRCPETLAPEELDDYLQNGWFRMGQTVFTTNFLHFKNQFYSAVWLRIVLAEFSGDNAQKKLTKLNRAFRSEIRQASINTEKEALFAAYKQTVSFEASPSLNHLLFGKSVSTIYKTYEVNIYNGEKLIATGFFDLGAMSAAGISSFYDPAYKKYSLGKYLIYLKIEYCKKLALKYFYPGYFVPGYSFFDYKLNIGKPALQFLQVSSQQWLPIDTFLMPLSPLQWMQARLSALQRQLGKLGIPSRLLNYEFFDANLIPDLMGAELFDFPVFLCVSRTDDQPVEVVTVYDVREQNFQLIRCRAVWKTNAKSTVGEVYSSYVLRSEQILFSTNRVEELVEIISMEAKLQASSK